MLLLAFTIGLSDAAFAQETDTTEQVADTTAASSSVEEEGASADPAMVSEAPAVAASADRASAAPAAAPEVESKLNIDPQVYANAFYYVLLFVLICVLVAVVGRILKVYDLTRKMNGLDTEYYMHKVHAYLFLIALIAGLYGVYWSYANHGAQAWRAAATEHGAKIDIMFLVTTAIITIVLVLTHISLFGFAFKYRATPTRRAYFYPHNNTIEKIWTIVPATVLTILVLFGFFTWRGITNVSEEDQAKAIHIEVVGEQFAWTVRYPGRDGKLGERNYKLISPLNSLGIDFNDKDNWDDQLGGEIVLPVNRPVRVQIGSKDILHSFFIPDFRVQMNAVPGMKTYFQFTPTVTTEEMRAKLDDYDYDFVMLCAKICGGGHYNMQKRIRIVTEEEYQAWLNEQPYFFTEDLRKEFQLSQQETSGNDDAKLLATAVN